MSNARLRAFLALLLYGAAGLGTPVLDAVLSHREGNDRALHVEPAGETGCHHDACVLDAPGAPQAPAGSPVAAAPLAAPRDEFRGHPLADQHRDRTPARPHAARAPPHTT